MAEKDIPFSLLRTASWDPFQEWQASRIFDQAFGMPPLPEDFATFPSSHWPGYLRPSILGPDMGHMGHMVPHYPGFTHMTRMPRSLSRQFSGGHAEITKTGDAWKVSLDVKHFAPEEIVVKIKNGVLNISAKHEDRLDEHGYVSRSFTRKYTVPSNVPAEKLHSTLTRDGVLTVQGPLITPALMGADTNVPVLVEEAAKPMEN